MKERIIAYDYIRIVAMLMVVACHCFGDTTGASPTLISLLSYMEMPCNGLFFAVSGALLLPVNVTADKTGKFLVKRLTKVVIPTVVWSVVYLAISGKLNIASICSIPFTPVGASIFWFVYVMVGLYIISPVISPWLEKADKRTLLLYLGIWCISLCYPIIRNWLPVHVSEVSSLYYLSGYVGFFVLGYYLKRFGIKLGLSAIMYFVAFAVMIGVKLFANNIQLYDGFWYLTVFCVVSVIFYWNLIEWLNRSIKLNTKVRTSLITTSNLIFGVYFIHYGIIEYLLPQIPYIDSMPYIAGYACRILIAFAGALFISYIIAYLPFSNYIIGYGHNK